MLLASSAQERNRTCRLPFLVVEAAQMDPSGLAQQVKQDGHQENCLLSTSAKDTANIPDNRRPNLGTPVPNLGLQNLIRFAAAGGSNQIAQVASFAGCSTSMLNAMHENTIPYAAPSAFVSHGADQHAGPSIQPFGNLPEGYSRVPINILVLKKRQAGSQVRPQLPFSQNVLAPAFPQGEQDGPVQLAPNHFLLLGRPSNMVASDTALTPLAPATPDKYKLADSPRCFQQRDLDTEMPKAGTGKEASRLQQSAIAVDENSGSKPVAPITPVKAKGLQGQHARELTDLARGSFEDNMQKYQTLPKQTKTEINQSDDPTLSTPTVSIECTKTLPEIRQTEISNNEKETPGRKQRPQRKKHRPKVIGEGKPAKTRKAAVATPEVKPPNQTAKRSYVRKKRSLSSLENSSEPISGKSNGSKAGMTAKSSTASVRRKLHFEHEERAASGEQPSMVNTWHIKPEKLPHPQRPECSVTKSAIQIGQGLPVAVENSLGELAFGLSRRMNKMLDEYICFSEATSKATPDNPPAASGCFSRAMMVDDLGQLAMKQDNIGSTHNPDKTGQSVLHTEGRLGKTFTEGKRRNLELNSSNVDDLQIYRSVTSLSERESVLNQISKVQQVEKWNHEQHNNGGFTTAGGQDSVSLRTAAEMLTLCQAGGIKKKRSVQACRLSFTPIKNLEDSTLEASQKSSRSCLEALYESTHIKFMTKKRSQKARLHSPSSVESKMQHKKRVSTESIFLGGSNGSSASEGTFQGTLPSAMSSYIPDNKSISLDICRKVPNKSLASTSIAPYMDSLQSVAWNLKYLDLNAEQIHRTEMKLSAAASHTICLSRAADPANALVPYVSRAVVPHERPLHLVKKQRPRAKVDLDNESTRVWKLLMGKSVDPADGTDDEKEKWWKQEREVFQSRANAFIARMRLVQGDRRFSPWKGSVVDSVVGVFLTQNVADHLSSSAFMALAASFPPRSINSNSKDGGGSKYNGEIISTNAVQDESMIHFFENSVQLDIDVHCEDLSVTYEKTHTDPKDNTGANELVKGDRYSCYDEASNGSLCNHQGTGMTPNGQQFAESSPIELAASTKNALEMTFHQEIDYSQSILTTQTIPPSRLTLSSGKDCAPGNFVGDLGDTAPQELRSNSNGGKALVGNVAAIDEVPCKRFRMATKTDDVYHPGISSGSMFCPLISNIDRPKTDERNKLNVSSTPPYGSSGSASLIMKDDSIDEDRSLFISIDAPITTNNGNKNVDVTLHFSETSTEPTVKLHHNIMNGFEASDLQEHKSSSTSGGMITEIVPTANEFCLKSGATSYCGAPDTAANISKPAKTMAAGKNTESFDWDSLRRQACSNGYKKERSSERRDSIDWEAVRCADVHRISHAIRDRGMNNVLAERIQNFLNRLVRDHGSIDLEWLRDIPPDSAKIFCLDYLLSIRGLGLKSAECVRLLTLHHLAFPVDTNVGRICVRLGWVPIQPLPESLQLHLLELYPVQETIQKYLWPRLCILDQQTLYELHYQMITFGKVFCTKNKPNCNACPMRSECKHFASAFASARLALPAPQDKNIVNSINQFVFQNAWMPALKSTAQPQLEGRIHARDLLMDNSMPIIEEPASPREKESPGTLENEIEDFYEDSDEIPTIKLNIEAFAQNLEDCIKESNKDLQTEDIAKALVAISSEAASIPVPKLKNVNRLRTEHYVYELPDSHPLVQQLELDQREPDDPSPYLLIIRMADETKETSQARKSCCNSQVEGRLCNNEMCHACVSEREIQSRYVSGTILVPCRTAMRGSFPLNGTYFQVNEVFADHNSSHNPILVPREQLWNLQRRMVYFGTSVPTIFKGLTTEEIQQCFWRGFVCVRGFDRETRAPKPLCPHLHIAASKLPRTCRAEKMNR